METVEPVFGQIKQGRGFRQFLLRGLEKVNREWLLICAGHNLLKLFRFGSGLPDRGRRNDKPSNSRSPRLAAGRFTRILSAFTNPHRPSLAALQLILGRAASLVPILHPSVITHGQCWDRSDHVGPELQVVRCNANRDQATPSAR